MKSYLRKLVSKGKTEQAIQLILENIPESHDLHHEMVMLSGRFSSHKGTKRKRTTSSQEQNLLEAQINDTLLEIINQLDDSDLPSAPPEGLEEHGEDIPYDPTQDETAAAQSNSPNWWKYVAGIGVIIGILAGTAGITGYSLRDFLGMEQSNSFSLTVFVHGKQGKDDRILKNQGKVVLDIGTARQEATINEKGEATFKELPAHFKGDSALISIDHPQPYLPKNRNVKYALTPKQAIYLEVELKGINQIKGTILDYENEQPLDSVRVSVENVASYSDEFGWFELDIPAAKQKKFVQVTFIKTGYHIERLDSIAPHTQQQIGISLRKQ